jgi:hypothetical protein
MRKCFVGMSMLAAVASLALLASGQVTGSRPKTVTTGGPAHIARLPYTAEYKVSSLRTLANGATMSPRRCWHWTPRGGG